MSKPRFRSLLSICFATVGLAACDQDSASPDVEETAALLAEAIHVEDFTLTIPAERIDVEHPSELPVPDAFTAESDPNEMKCYKWQDESGCSTCIMKVPLTSCSVWQDTCGGSMYNNCGWE